MHSETLSEKRRREERGEEGKEEERRRPLFVKLDCSPNPGIIGYSRSHMHAREELLSYPCLQFGYPI